MQMSNDAREARNAYYRDYYKRNKGKVQEYQRRYRASHPDVIARSMAAYWERKAAAMSERKEGGDE